MIQDLLKETLQKNKKKTKTKKKNENQCKYHPTNL